MAYQAGFGSVYISILCLLMNIPRILLLLFELGALILLFLGLNTVPVIHELTVKHNVLRVMFSFLTYVLTIDLIRRVVGYSYGKRNRIGARSKDNFLFGINNIAKVLIGVGGIVAMFGMFGIDLMTLITSLSIVAAAISIIMKEYINDFLVGIYFSFSKNFEINDYVQLAGQKGKITEIQLLKIKLLNDDDDLLIMPNSKVYGNDIINYTKRDIRLMSIDFQIDINLVDDIESLENELITALKDFEEFLEADAYNIKIVEMRKDSLDLKFQYKLKKLDYELQRQIRRKTVRHVFNHITSKQTKIKEPIKDDVIL